ncbi:MAG: glycine cleavage system aminomethyltransferase GcvT [Acidobacteriota bacterium]|jgi:aminomethyltransferase|nr:glycine cleavage system aminomethyltransferase GcvT [Acidobacteriota bacterium]
MLKRTPLYESHKKLGGKMIDFGGWEMPIQYTSIIEEHTATREKAGLFDVSHMGEILLKGRSAKETLNRLVTNDIFLLTPKKAAYTFLTTEKGGVVDDILVYMINDDEFLLVVNASNTDKDYAWLKEKAAEFAAGLEVINCSSDYVQIAIQGPFAQTILKKLAKFDLDQIKFFSFDYVELCGEKVILSRTGYTGEDGFEVLCSPSRAEEIWSSLLEAGKNEGIKPVGLGARDTLRFESALPLYGHELGYDISPIEAGLKFFVKLNKDDYLGKSILKNQVERGTERLLAGIEIIERGIPRDGYRIEKGGEDVGYITSGAYSPTFKKGLAMALLKTDIVQPGNELDVVIRDKKVKAKIVKLPFYNKKTKVNT